MFPIDGVLVHGIDLLPEDGCFHLEPGILTLGWYACSVEVNDFTGKRGALTVTGREGVEVVLLRKKLYWNIGP